eukprot:g847.t1
MLLSWLLPVMLPLPLLPDASPPDPTAAGLLASAGVSPQLLLVSFLRAGARGLVVGGWPAAANHAGLV